VVLLAEPHHLKREEVEQCPIFMGATQGNLKAECFTWAWHCEYSHFHNVKVQNIKQQTIHPALQRVIINAANSGFMRAGSLELCPERFPRRLY